MIVEVPTAEDFHKAGLNQLYLAWRFALQVTEEFEKSEAAAYHLSDAEAQEASHDYWNKSQPALANSYSLVQQAMEMALKARIARVSPYLLIARDPKEWPRGVDTKPIPFSAFRTLDAADLLRVHNAFSTPALDVAFQTFWDNLRRERNKVMHSVSGTQFDATLLIRSILSAAKYLFPDRAWPQHLFYMETEGPDGAYGWDVDYQYNFVMRQTAVATRYLAPAECKQLLGFDKKKRAYVCPHCLDSANRDYQEEFPALAQLSNGSVSPFKLNCIVCQNATEVERGECIRQRCLGTVLHDNTCLTCLGAQDSPYAFFEPKRQSQGGESFDFHFKRDSTNHTVSHRCLNPNRAKAIGRAALKVPYLQDFAFVAITTGRLASRSAIGTWERRAGDKLEWRDKYAPSFAELHGMARPSENDE